jgi:hypothetical protein
MVNKSGFHAFHANHHDLRHSQTDGRHGTGRHEPDE